MTDKLEWHELDAIANRHPSIKAGYAEATGGQDLPFIIRELASVLEDDGWERKRAIAAIHWVFNADGTVSERSMAQEAIHKINDPTFMPSPPKLPPPSPRLNCFSCSAWFNTEWERAEHEKRDHAPPAMLAARTTGEKQ